jgi:iron(III) transport system permease protein
MLNKLNRIRRDFNQWSLFTAAIGFFVAIPILTITVYLFDGVGDMWEHIVNYFLLEYIQNSIVLLIGTGILTTLLGTSSAWVISNYNFPLRSLLKWLLFLPLAIPSYILAYAYVGLLGNGGTLIGCLQTIGFSIQKIELMNIYGLIWVLSFSLFPYVYASSLAMFSSIPRSIRESSDLLGASNWRYLRSVAFPLASPAIISGLFLVFMEVLNDYGAAKYYGINTFTTGIFRTWTMLEDLQSAVYLSALLIVMVVIINSLVKWQRGSKSYAVKGSTDQLKSTDRIDLKGNKRLLVWTIIGMPILFGLILPLGQLFYWATLTYEKTFNIELLQIALQSFTIALVTTGLILLTSLALIYFSRWNHLKSLHFFKKVATIGYVIPGAIIGIGVIRSSQSFITFFDDVFSLEIGFIFYSSSVVLIYAYVFRFLAVVFHPLEANSLKVGKNISEASYLLNVGKIKTLFNIELPLLRTALLTSGILVFIDVLKELPLTLILKPYNVQTLAVKAYEYADDERVAEAALPALMLILTITISMAFISYLQKRDKLNI